MHDSEHDRIMSVLAFSVGRH